MLKSKRLGAPIIAISYYHWARGGNEEMLDKLQSISEAIAEFKRKYPIGQIIVMGDFNKTRDQLNTLTSSSQVAELLRMHHHHFGQTACTRTQGQTINQ